MKPLRNHSHLLALAALPACSLLSGCLVVGYSTRGGAFIWPGGFGLVLIIVLLWLFLRGR